MCTDFQYSKRIQLTVEKHPELVTAWYKRWGTSLREFNLVHAITQKAITPKVGEWFETTGFDVVFRVSLDQCHMTFIFDDEMEFKLFRIAFGC